MWRWVVFWNTSRILMRGSVAFRPLFFSSSACVMAGSGQGHRGRPGKPQPLESTDHIEVGARSRRAGSHTMRFPVSAPVLRPRRSAVAGRRPRPLAVASRCSRPTASSAWSRPTGSRSCRATSSPRSRPRFVKTGMSRAAGARHPRLAAAHRPVPRRPLGLRLHDPPPGRRAAAAPRRGAVRRRKPEEHWTPAATCRASATSSPRSTPSRPRATRRRWS